MATHINTTNAIKGLTCVTEHLKALEVLFIAPAIARHPIQHLTDAGLEIERLNSEAIKLRHENSQLKEKLNNKTTDLDELRNSYGELWQSMLHAVAGTDAGRSIYSPTDQLTVIRAVAAIKKTEADRKEALRTAEAFQKAQPKAEPVEDIFEIVSREILSGFFPRPHTLNFSNLARNFTQEHDSRIRYEPISTEIIDEAIRASSIHPDWPTDALHAVSILSEKSGDLTDAAVNYHYHDGDLEAVRHEATQVGALALRVLLSIDKYKRPSGKK
ncbi:TPA: hypothetical protein ACGIZ8_002846 [Yersinia enterocolitica]|nr:hypothetical protein [Yersinia enterocolitica]HDV5953274.1 hypothetical protein [Yersinia enterocolitica]HED5568473.1 hypothetical protein [Yersinia enterocolitica]